ncbi:hypothetical protein GSI_03262 [Ganoderma sinense ZZ0214-1]|uniref:Uncharacterized protein n=1 Tax=Ganoderma sinense ZZ0214-1 TaxID=1077348 RepID=A0A2G8SL36_9APHY|nr:hypothetical protein GSI_03262 [Ganoderma sinense ZZ0214-1]
MSAEPSHAFDPSNFPDNTPPSSYALSTPAYEPTAFPTNQPPYLQTLQVYSQSQDLRDVDMASNKSSTSELLRGIQEQLGAQHEQASESTKQLRVIQEQLTAQHEQTSEGTKQLKEMKEVISDLKDEIVVLSKTLTQFAEHNHTLLEGITDRLDHIEKDGSSLRKGHLELCEEARQTQKNVETFKKHYDDKTKTQTTTIMQAFQEIGKRLRSRRGKSKADLTELEREGSCYEGSIATDE